MNKSFEEIFEIELKCWCFGISNSNEKLDQKLLHRILKEFSNIFRESIENLYEFDLIQTSKRLIVAGNCDIPEREVVFHILSYLPTPCELTKEQNEVLNNIVTKVENIYGGAFERLAKKWNSSKRKLESHSSNNFLDLLDPLQIPSLRK